MFFHRLLQLGAVLIALALALVPALAIDQITFTGDVTYRERIALPPDASLTVTLVSIDAKGVPHEIGATAVIQGPGQVPLHFTLHVRSDAISASGDYGLIAQIDARGVPLFRSLAPVRVDPASPEPVLILTRASPPPAILPLPAIDADPAAALFDTIWIARTIAGKDVLKATEVTLSIASDHRAGGNAGCNSYFTEAVFDGPALEFGPVAGTQMACDIAVMQQEQAFFTALGAVTRYELGATTLVLLDVHGKPEVQFVRH